MVVVAAAAIILNNISIITIFMLFSATLLVVTGTKYLPLNKHYAIYLCLLVFWISLVLMPSIHLIEPIMKRYTPVTNSWCESILEFGMPFFLYISVFFFITSINKNKNHVRIPKYMPIKIKEKLVYNVLYFCIALSLFSYSIGLGRMASDQVELPFHLSGIINLVRWTLIPTLFAIYVENNALQNKKVSSKIWLIYILWCLVEIFAWMSKSVLLYHLLPVLIVVYMSYKPRLKQMLKYIIPIATIFLILYPIIEIARTADKDSGSLMNIMQDAAETSNSENKSSLLAPLNRTFMFGAQFAQDYKYINTTDLFDFSKIPLLIASGGSAGFQTFVIDEFPITAHHSSGTCGIMDPLLHGGKGLLYLVITLLLFLALFIDNLVSKSMFSIATILLLKLANLCAFVNISSLYDSVGLQTFALELLGIYIAFKINFKNKGYNETN
jgi:hypothetical protein